jgi:methionine--tRNA ligase beta chain
MEQITFQDFAKIDIRIGEVIKAEVPEGSERVIKLSVDFGEEFGERTIFAGIKQWYTPGELVGMRLPFILNIPPKKMGELGESQGMLLAVIGLDDDGEERPVLLAPENKVPPGSQLR